MQSTAPAVRIRSCCVHGGHRRTLPARLASRRSTASASARRCLDTMTRVRRSGRCCACWSPPRSSPPAAGTPRTCASPTTRPSRRRCSGPTARCSPPSTASRTASRSRSTAMAPSLPKAVVAIEDERFFDHDGVDARGVVRALTRDVQEGNLDEGGSTITQQYVRAVMLGPEKDLERKLREAVMAVQLEHRYSKRTILERYLNTIYFGNGAYGVQAAARRYFGQDAARPRPRPESALLAGVIRAPETYNPFMAPGPRARPPQRGARPARATSTGSPAADVARARAAPLGLAPPADRRAATPRRTSSSRSRKLILANQAFGATADQRRRLLLEGGLRIHTTLDPQHAGPRRAGRGPGDLASPRPTPRPRSSRSIPATGQVKAYVGGSDFWGAGAVGEGRSRRHRLLRASGSGCRQAGQHVQAVRARAPRSTPGVPLSQTYDAPASLTIPQPGGQEPWVVNNYDGSGRGRMDLTEATVNSVNTVYAQLVMDIGAQPVVDLADEDGRPLAAARRCRPPRSGATARPCSTWRRRTTRSPATGCTPTPVLVTRVTTQRRHACSTRRRSSGTRVLSETTARTITGVLQQVVNRGTGVNARIGRPVAGKTGTSDDWADAWFVGYTPELVTAVWVGLPRRRATDAAADDADHGHRRIVARADLAAVRRRARSPRRRSRRSPRPRRPTTPTTTAPDADASRTTPALGRSGCPSPTRPRTLRDAGYRVRLRDAPSREYPPGHRVRPRTRSAGPAGASPARRSPSTCPNGPPRSVTRAERARRLRRRGRGDAAAPRASRCRSSCAPEPPPGSPTRAGRVWKQSPISGAARGRRHPGDRQRQPRALTRRPASPRPRLARRHAGGAQAARPPRIPRPPRHEITVLRLTERRRAACACCATTSTGARSCSNDSDARCTSCSLPVRRRHEILCSTAARVWRPAARGLACPPVRRRAGGSSTSSASSGRRSIVRARCGPSCTRSPCAAPAHRRARRRACGARARRRPPVERLRGRRRLQARRPGWPARRARVRPSPPHPTSCVSERERSGRGRAARCGRSRPDCSSTSSRSVEAAGQRAERGVGPRPGRAMRRGSGGRRCRTRRAAPRRRDRGRARRRSSPQCAGSRLRRAEAGEHEAARPRSISPSTSKSCTAIRRENCTGLS